MSQSKRGRKGWREEKKGERRGRRGGREERKGGRIGMMQPTEIICEFCERKEGERADELREEKKEGAPKGHLWIGFLSRLCA